MRAFFGLIFGNIRHQLPKFDGTFSNPHQAIADLGTAIPSFSFGKREIHNDDIQGVEQSATGRTLLSEARSE
jgi:hypothetical protein